MTRAYGIDVSHFQSPKAPGGLPWSLLRAQGVAFAMVRATYGTYRDPSAAQHVSAARAVGIQVGLYHFFRVEQPVTDQLAAFNAQAVACGIRAGDICPALDLEDEPGVPKLAPSWSAAAEALIAGLVTSYGEALLYVTQRDFNRLGAPAWALERPLWVAHYTAAQSPATPGGKPWRIWQHRVGPFAPNGAGGVFNPQTLDQDRADVPLPICTRVPALVSAAVPSDGPAPDHGQTEISAARLDAATNDLYAGLDIDGHDADKSDTDPAPTRDKGE